MLEGRTGSLPLRPDPFASLNSEAKRGREEQSFFLDQDRQREGSHYRIRWIPHKIYRNLFLTRDAHALKQVRTRNVRNLQNQFLIEMNIVLKSRKLSPEPTFNSLQMQESGSPLCFSLFFYPTLIDAGKSCPYAAISENSPSVRFPLRLKVRQPESSGYPGVEVSCSERNEKLIEFPFSGQFLVTRIDYE
ncbi:Uncharacterized protein TCM_005742 [Theobroma cacao]|uniref:RING-type E3 ubiquitin transferase n=1 Tax=Theobroma cacao TaxID=3641 RepID=A0A061DVR9_THECC|nr:Uncharacterized protein TCM_005742 [Theobroma cacao]